MLSTRRLSCALKCKIRRTTTTMGSRTVGGAGGFTHDLNSESSLPVESGSIDLIVAAQIMWYVLPNLDRIIAGFHSAVRPGGNIVIQQSLLASGEQKYGIGVLESAGDIKRA